MEPLVFRHNILAKRLIGLFWILIGISNLVLISKDPVTFTGWGRSIICIILGIIFFTPISGRDETSFMSEESNLKIKWRTRLPEYVININEIEKIVLRNKKIEILRKNKKAVVLQFGEWLWSLEDKRKVYEFMIKYAQLQNLNLEK